MWILLLIVLVLVAFRWPAGVAAVVGALICVAWVALCLVVFTWLGILK